MSLKSLRQEKFRLSIVMFLGALGFVLIAVRGAQIQLMPDPRLTRLASRQFETKSERHSKRAPIFDRNGKALALPTVRYSLATSPRMLQQYASTDSLLESLKAPLGYSKKQLKGKIQEWKDFVWLKRFLTEAQKRKLEQNPKLKSHFDQKLIWFKEESVRFYPSGSLASTVLGAVNIDAKGIEGVELWQEEQLAGRKQVLSGLKDARGRATFREKSQRQWPAEPEPLTLTLDASLQFEVEHALRAAVRSTRSDSGEVIVMDADTGEILVMANVPDFNPNQKATEMDARRNRCVTDQFEPGSTLKAVLLSAALSHGWKVTDALWNDGGKLQLQGHTITEANATSGQGAWVDLKEMIRRSSNVIAGKLALKVGVSDWSDHLRLFGFGAKTGLGFPGEVSGRVPEFHQLPLPAQELELATTGFGQGLTATPLQMVRAFAVFANGGYLVRPRLLRSKEVVLATERIIAPDVAQSVSTLLSEVTEASGTGKLAGIAGFKIAGKTGTSQTVDPQTKQYSKKNYIASFVGFPLEVAPRLVGFVALHHPKDQYYASQTAAPLFSSVMGKALQHYRVPAPNHGIVFEPSFDGQTQAEIDPFLREQLPGKMPDLKGLSLSDALSLLVPQLDQVSPACALRVIGVGFIHKQVPLAGHTLKYVKRVTLTLKPLEQTS